MSASALLEEHRSNVEDIVFSSSTGTFPSWLRFQGQDCRERYKHFRLIPEFHAAINAFSDDTPKPFELFIVGEGKFGKSTLVNALLGERRSKARGLPETRCFLRYVVSEEPSNQARLYLRLQPGIHDWIEPLVGRGRYVPELFGISEYITSGDVARQILEGEAQRLDEGSYSPAVFEVERDVLRTEHSSFPSGVRLVDTQGLDQLFPDDLRRVSASLDESDATKRLMDWMAETPRGKHLEWQFRRSDAVLWCVNAKRVGSAATETYLRYFSSYAKKIVIALTNIDLVAKKPEDLNRLVDKAREKYRAFAKVICPINGELALEGALARELEQIDRSGLADLTEELTNICIAHASKTRTVSRYMGLRRTESQFRKALGVMRVELTHIDQQYRNDVATLKKELDTNAEQFFNWLKGRVEAESDRVYRSVPAIDLSDERSSAIDKIGISQFRRNLESQVDNAIRQRIIPKVKQFAGRLKPYRVPTFDAEGAVAEDLLSLSVDIPYPEVPFIRLYFSLALDDEFFTRARLWFTENIVGLFSSEAKASAIRERDRLTQQRCNYVWSSFLQQWGEAAGEWGEKLAELLIELHGPVRERLDAIMTRIESIEGRPIGQTVSAIDVALKGRSSNLAICERFISALTSSHCFSSSGSVHRPAPRPPDNLSTRGNLTPVTASRRLDSERESEGDETDRPQGKWVKNNIASTLERFHRRPDQLSGCPIKHRALGTGRIVSVRFWHGRLDGIDIRFDGEMGTYGVAALNNGLITEVQLPG